MPQDIKVLGNYSVLAPGQTYPFTLTVYSKSEIDAFKDGSLSFTSANVRALTTADFGGNKQLTIFCDASTAAFVVPLPTAASFAGFTVNVVKTDSSANSVTVKGNGAELINAANTTILSNQYQSVVLKSNGTQSYIF